MMFYKGMKSLVPLLDADTDFLDTIAKVFQGDTLALYVFIIC